MTRFELEFIIDLSLTFGQFVHGFYQYQTHVTIQSLDCDFLHLIFLFIWIMIEGRIDGWKSLLHPLSSLLALSTISNEIFESIQQVLDKLHNDSPFGILFVDSLLDTMYELLKLGRNGESDLVVATTSCLTQLLVVHPESKSRFARGIFICNIRKV